MASVRTTAHIKELLTQAGPSGLPLATIAREVGVDIDEARQGAQLIGAFCNDQIASLAHCPHCNQPIACHHC